MNDRKEILEGKYSAEEIADMKIELKNLQSSIRDLDITKNRRINARHTVNVDDMERHRAIGERIREIEAIMSSEKRKRVISAQDDQIFKDLLRETLGIDDYIKIMQEYSRRRSGETYLRVTVKHRDSKAGELTKKIINHLDRLKTIRKTLTDLNIKGCAAFGVSEFMRMVSPLNTLVPPIQDIEKEKRSLV
jgi:hypothetical protein